MLILIAFYCESIVCEQSSIAVMSVPEVNLIVGLYVVKLSSFDDEALEELLRFFGLKFVFCLFFYPFRDVFFVLYLFVICLNLVLEI